VVAEKRATVPEKLERELSGDLDTIVLKALRKEPQRWYLSAEQFSEDLHRHLIGLQCRHTGTPGVIVRKRLSGGTRWEWWPRVWRGCACGRSTGNDVAGPRRDARPPENHSDSD
jgi:hypothetical protein